MPEDDTASEREPATKPCADGGNARAALAQACAVGVKNVLLLGYGMTLGFPTIVIPAIQGGDGREPALEKDVTLSREQISWLSSINLICVPLGSIFSGMLAQPIGRRRAMQLINIPIFIAWMLFHYASDVNFLYLGLALAGLSGGLGEAPVLTYVAEITQPRYRGMLAATGSTCVILGVLMEFLMGSFLKWRTVALVSSSVPVLAALLLFLIPESPVWLASKGRLEESKSALAWLRGWVSKEDVDEEFKELEQQMTKAAELQKDFTIIDKARLYTQRAFLQPFGIILLCFFIGHFSGMTTLQTYAVQIFHTLKAPINKYYATCLLGLTELIGTLFCVFLVHRTGKRPLVFISTIGCAICFFGAASYAYFLNDIPGGSVQNVVANVSSIRADIAVIPLRSKEVIAEWKNSSVIELLNLTAIEPPNNGSTNIIETPQQQRRNGSSDGILYAAQSFTNYYLNDSLDEPINITISYGEYVQSAIPKDVFVPLPLVNRNKLVWVPLTLLLGSAFLTHIGIRLIPWILIGELFAPNVRSGGSGLAGGIAYIFGFIANKTFLKMLAIFSLPGTFWIYSLVTVVGAMILYKVLPETEGKTLQEIETYFASPRKRSVRFDQEAPAPRPGPKLSTGSAAATQPPPPPIPPKPYPLKDDIDRARRISLLPRQMSQSSRNTTVSDFSVASFNSQGTAQLSRSTSRTSYTLEDTHDQPEPQIFRKISETLPETPARRQSEHIPASPKPPAIVRNHSTDTFSKMECPSPPATRRRGSAVGSNHLFRGVYEMHLKIPPHKIQPMTRPVRARAKRPPPSHVVDCSTWDSNRKFEEFLHRHKAEEVPPAVRPMRNVTSAHDLKTFELKHLVVQDGTLKDRNFSFSDTKLTPTDGRGRGETQLSYEGGMTNAAFHLSSSDESTAM
ncbi:solute carrier family 2, facilitated glucose transporter member 10-like [Anopheles ziemanni]|uniref:solute carrier family 2, facilitated glucose transporter member 10-like n=1 Tax=Anopheles coustani TaxID=139045 RepID=UPI0026593605|nr:solute carrier family 2, facilitated glucose transporter member 10-like [Anopheles coustani]XP_058174293.1 solute carrier family 2, facilitated glucose transporter member 10-like [Anopheles ziemanni]